MEDEDMTLSQALGLAAGLVDEQSDPKGVFVFRYEDSENSFGTGRFGHITRRKGKYRPYSILISARRKAFSSLKFLK